MSGVGVRVRLLRPYPRDGKEHSPGDVILVPQYAVPALLEARPPKAELVDGHVQTTEEARAAQAARAVRDEEERVAALAEGFLTGEVPEE